ncbi:MAG TPA: DNA gyrase subunit A [Armatimonadota bacterium]|jgi:DNA gyrase subunit A
MSDEKQIARTLTDVSIVDEMKDSYMRFAMSVIISRALPDVRDGLKPSQRRVLFAMNEINLNANGPTRKCAAIVGECMGKYHPHGDASIYDTLVRMAQDWNSRYPLVHPKGNFGSVDGDPPAAMRYTEAKLTPLGAELLADIDQDTVDFIPNFDETTKEPTVLPAAFPNLICNGSSGIAVGMATEMAPHNLGEVIDACALLIDRDGDVSVDQLLEVMPGPDFPTGGLILGAAGIREAYATGHGACTMQARTVIEPAENGKMAIIVTELPFQVNKSRLVEQIADLVKEKKIQGISDLRDESDRVGMKMVIELKRDANPHVILNQLYKHTPLRKRFNFNMVGIVQQNGKPEPHALTMLDLLNEFLTHRREVVTRRTKFELKKQRERAHILEGYRIALHNLDAVIKLIRESRNPTMAREGLMHSFGMSEKQAQAVLDLQLHRLTSLEIEKIEKEFAEVMARIAYLEELLANTRKLMAVVKSELLDMKKRHADARRTRMRKEEASDLSIEDLIDEEDVIITMTRDGYVKRLPLDTYRTQGRGGKGIIGLTTKEEDMVEHLFIANTHSYLMVFTDKGKVYRLRTHEVPAASRTARGANIINLISIDANEVVTAVLNVKEFPDDKYLFMVTEQGVVKKTALSEFANIFTVGKIAITLKDETDALRWVKVTDGSRHMVLATHHGMSIRFSEEDVRTMGRTAAGVRGIDLRTGDRVVGVAIVRPNLDLLAVTELGYGKRTPLAEYRVQTRGGKGIKTVHITEKNGPLVDCKVVDETDDVLLISTGGQVIRSKVGDIRETGRSAQGVRVMRMNEDIRIACVTVVVKKEEIAEDIIEPDTLVGATT